MLEPHRQNAVMAASNLQFAREDYQTGFRKWMSTMDKLPAPRFWELCKLYSALAISRLNTESGADEFFRLALVGSSEGATSFEEAIRFALTYSIVVNNITRYFDKSNKGVIWGRGDDSFGDVMDNLPLVGKEFYQTAKRSRFQNISEVEAEVSKAVQGNPKYMKFIMYGENYNRTNLEEKAAEFFISTNEVQEWVQGTLRGREENARKRMWEQ